MSDWSDLKYVLETVRRGGISGAGRALGVNHATVSRRINAAEQAIGTLLFDRLPGGYAPTEAGLEAARTAELMEKADADLSRAIGARDHKMSGPLTITAPQLLLEGVLMPILEKFRTANPAVKLTVLASADILNLSRREADVAVRISNNPVETLFGARVAEQRVAVYTNREYLKLQGSNPGKSLNWIMLQHWSEIPSDITSVWPETKISLTLDNLGAVRSAIRAGAGAARIPCFLGEEDPDLVRLPHLPTFPYSNIWVLTHNDLRRVKRIGAFMEFITARLRARRGLFEGLPPHAEQKNSTRSPSN